MDLLLIIIPVNGLKQLSATILKPGVIETDPEPLKALVSQSSKGKKRDRLDMLFQCVREYIWDCK